MNKQIAVETKHETRNPWAWVPSLYYAEGIPYVVVMTVAVLFYQGMGLSNTDIALYTSWLYLPWVIKPLWSPVVDVLKTKRLWIISMQLIIGAALGGLALSIPLPGYFKYSMAFFWLIAFSSATHDIAADGFYMLGLTEKNQSFFVGIRSTFYRLAMITGQGILIIIAGYLQTKVPSVAKSWSYTFGILTALFLLFYLYHTFILPYPLSDAKKTDSNQLGNKMPNYLIFVAVFIIFLPFYILLIWLQPLTKMDPRPLLRKLPFSNNPFSNSIILFLVKSNFGIIILFMFIFRFGEAQLVKIAPLFLKAPRSTGGLGLSLEEIGIAYGTVGVVALTLGGILGGLLASKGGLKKWIWWMFAAINIPHILYIYMSYTQPSNLFIINLCVAGEQFGYGFGFTAYMLYMIYVSEGEFKTSHYAICTGFMALGMMIPGMFSGWIQEHLGYPHFFLWVLITMLPGYFIIKNLPLNPEFGKKD